MASSTSTSSSASSSSISSSSSGSSGSGSITSSTSSHSSAAGNNPASKALKRLSKEYSQFVSSLSPPLLSIQLVNDSILHWQLLLSGPSSSPYEGGRFLLDFSFPQDYPMKPPNVKFITPIYHVNVSMSQGGAICQELIVGGWSPILRVKDLIDRLQSLLIQPHAETPLEPEIGEMYASQPAKYKQIAQQWTKKHAMG